MVLCVAFRDLFFGHDRRLDCRVKAWRPIDKAFPRLCNRFAFVCSMMLVAVAGMFPRDACRMRFALERFNNDQCLSIVTFFGLLGEDGLWHLVFGVTVHDRAKCKEPCPFRQLAFKIIHDENL